MRILFTAWAWPSHLHGMAPTAWACRAAGHEVLVAGQPALVPTITRTGLPAASVGRDVDALATFRTLVHPPTDPAEKRRGPRVLRLFSALAEAMVDDLADLVRSWRADLVVTDPTALAGPLAGAATGTPVVRHLAGTDLMAALRDMLPDVLHPLARRLGVADVDPYGVATLDPCPAGLQVPTGSRRIPVGSLPYSGPGVLPERLPERSGRPRVLVTWGHTLGRVDPALVLAGDVARAVADPDVDVLLAVSDRQRAACGDLPPEVSVVTGAPLGALLPTCDAVVAHGGGASILAGLAHGLPQLHLPRLPDHVRHAGRLAEVGAGEVLPPVVEDTETLRDRVAHLLTDHERRATAERLRDELRGQPAPADVVTELVEIAAS